MRKMFSKAAFCQRYYCGILTTLFLLHGLVAPAQDNQERFKGYLKAVRSIMDKPDLQYSYRLSMGAGPAGKATETVGGMLVKHGNSYLDSNAQTLTVSGNGYFMKARLREKQAYVYKLSSIEKNTGVKLKDSSMPFLSIPDSMIGKAGRFALLSETGVIDFTYTLTDPSGPVSLVEFRLRKSDMALLDLIITTREKGGYQKTMHLFGFSNQVNAKRINPLSYFRVSGAGVTMLNKLQSFKVTALL